MVIFQLIMSQNAIFMENLKKLISMQGGSQKFHTKTPFLQLDSRAQWGRVTQKYYIVTFLKNVKFGHFTPIFWPKMLLYREILKKLFISHVWKVKNTTKSKLFGILLKGLPRGPIFQGEKTSDFKLQYLPYFREPKSENWYSGQFLAKFFAD